MAFVAIVRLFYPKTTLSDGLLGEPDEAILATLEAIGQDIRLDIQLDIWLDIWPDIRPDVQPDTQLEIWLGNWLDG